MNRITRTLIACMVIVLSFSSCLKSSTPKCEFDACAVVAPANEIADVQAYLTANNITGAVQHCSGVFYLQARAQSPNHVLISMQYIQVS
jgi:hypothetical protein